MKVFITGASGLIGSNIAKQLNQANHTVLGLARTEESAKTLSSQNITPILGDLSNLPLLSSTAKVVDAIIHCGFDHTLAFTGKGPEACEKDRDAIAAMCDGLLASNDPSHPKVFINSSGLLGNDGEDEFANKHPNPHIPRDLSENLVRSYYTDKGLKAINIRLSPVTYGTPKPHPFIGEQVSAAKKANKARYVGEGANLWSTCPAEDAAALYILALTSDIPKGACLNAVAVAYQTREIAEHIGKVLKVEVGSMSQEEAMTLGFVGMVMGLGGRISSDLTKKWTGWEPKGQDFWEHVDATYF
jgi:nucleoside-diphosphate-sugar epimerase